MACTQEQRLFLELNAQTEGAARRARAADPLRQHPRDRRLVARRQGAATPKIAALIAAAQLPAPEPVATVSYRSGGRCLVIGGADAAERAAAMLADKLDVSRARRPRPAARWRRTHARAVHQRPPDAPDAAGSAPSRPSGRATTRSTSTCARAATPASPPAPKARSTSATRSTWRACKSHRDCVRVCDAAGAIDFDRAPRSHQRDLRPRARPARAARVHDAPAAAGLLPRRRRRAQAARRRARSCAS